MCCGHLANESMSNYTERALCPLVSVHIVTVLYDCTHTRANSVTVAVISSASLESQHYYHLISSNWGIYSKQKTLKETPLYMEMLACLPPNMIAPGQQSGL